MPRLAYVSFSGQLFELEEDEITEFCRKHKIERPGNFRRIADPNQKWFYVAQWQGLWHVRWLQRVDKRGCPIPGVELVPVIGEPAHFLMFHAPDDMKLMNPKTLGSFLKDGYFPNGKGRPAATQYGAKGKGMYHKEEADAASSTR